MASNFTYLGRKYVVDTGVFDPVTHLSGIAAADHLAAKDWSNSTILEVGTGCGLLAGVLHDRGAQVTAVDISPIAVACARSNLVDTSVDVRESDLFAAVVGESFDVLVINPPYEVGRSRRPNLRSVDLLPRLAAEWTDVADRLVMMFPTDSDDILDASGFRVTCDARIATAGRELGVYVASITDR